MPTISTHHPDLQRQINRFLLKHTMMNSFGQWCAAAQKEIKAIRLSRDIKDLRSLLAASTKQEIVPEKATGVTVVDRFDDVLTALGNAAKKRKKDVMHFDFENDLIDMLRALRTGRIVEIERRAVIKQYDRPQDSGNGAMSI